MILIALFIGAILIVAAVRNSQGALFSALADDVPGFVVWAAAILAIGAIGFIPNLKPVSRGILALVIVVIVMNNYKEIIGGFSDSWQNPTPAPSGNDHSSAPDTKDKGTSDVLGMFGQMDDIVGQGFTAMGLPRF